LVIITASGHTNEVTCCKFFKNSSYIVSGSSDNTIRVWDSFSGEEKWVYYCEGGILGLETAGNAIIVGDSSGLIYYLELNNVAL
jgi:WD40 repeat protein